MSSNTLDTLNILTAFNTSNTFNVPYLHAGRVQAVISVDELNDGLLAISHGAVVLHAQVLQSLHQSPRHVPRLGRLYRRIDQPLPYHATAGETSFLRIVANNARAKGIGFFRTAHQVSTPPECSASIYEERMPQKVEVEHGSVQDDEMWH